MPRTIWPCVPAVPVLVEFPSVIVAALTVLAPLVESFKTPSVASAALLVPLPVLLPSRMDEPAVPRMDTEVAAERSSVPAEPVPVVAVPPGAWNPMFMALPPKLNVAEPPATVTVEVGSAAAVV